MMSAEMTNAKLYPPQHRQNTKAAVESVTVTLLNLERSSVCDEVSHFTDTRDEIANKDLCKCRHYHFGKMQRSWGWEISVW